MEKFEVTARRRLEDASDVDVADIYRESLSLDRFAMPGLFDIADMPGETKQHILLKIKTTKLTRT